MDASVGVMRWPQYEWRLRRFVVGDEIPDGAQYECVMREGDETAIYYRVHEVVGWVEEIPPTPRSRRQR